MKSYYPSLLAGLSLITASTAPLNAEETPETHVVAENKAAFEPFTAKVLKNKVRMRLQPNYESPILGELQKGDLVLALEEAEDFYAVQPPPEARGYIFRTYVLDNVVEGNKVNIRLKPDLDAPVVDQLQTGDKVEGAVSQANNKWLEIKLPPTSRYYISKDYVEKIGDANLLAQQTKRREEVNQLLRNAEQAGAIELRKPFEQTNIDSVRAVYQHIINHYADFPDATQQAKEQLSKLESSYTAKKMSYLESKAHRNSSALEQQNKKLAEELTSHKKKVRTLEQQLEDQQREQPQPQLSSQPIPKAATGQLPVHMATWLPKEETLFNAWVEQTGKGAKEYGEEQRNQSFVLKGIIEPYNRPVKNKPGDFVLVNTATRLPIAFLYSTQINLQDLVGHETAIRVTPRPNNNYAFPAYFVLSIE